MKILALEFSSEQRSVAIGSFENSQFHLLGSTSEIGGRSTRAIHLIETVLQEARLERENINCIAVGIGPGSYTGIRAAIALTQGWQLAKNINTIGISSAEAIAGAARKQGLSGAVHIEIDAQRNEFYLAKYELQENALREIEPLHLVSFQHIETLAVAGATILGPEAEKFLNGRKIFPDAALIAELASVRSDFIPAEKLELIYLREVAFVKAPPPRVI